MTVRAVSYTRPLYSGIMAHERDAFNMQIPSKTATMFDELNDETFARLANAIVGMTQGQDGFTPGPLQGRDGGLDAQYVRASESEPKMQYKFHKVGSWAGTTPQLRSKVRQDFCDFIKEKFDGGPGPYMYFTNVERTQDDIDKTIDFERGFMAQGAKIDYWDSVRILSVMDGHTELYQTFLPHYCSQDLGMQADELKAQREKLQQAEEAARRRQQTAYKGSDEFQSLSQKFTTQFADQERLRTVYGGMLYIAQPFYVDDKDGARDIIRALFNIGDQTEQEIIDALKGDAKIDITGNVMTCNDVAFGKQAAVQVLEFMESDLDKVLQLLQRRAT